MIHPAFSCPVCKQALSRQDKGLVCPGAHSFDFAKEGYINLLPVQHKGSKTPGDSQDMVMARRAFLSSGHYEPLRDTLVQIITSITTEPDVLIDCGCGEGYYTKALAENLPDTCVYGLDIAKPAVRYAAKRSNKVFYAVASTSKLPFADNFADVLCKVFAPVDHQQVQRVLKPQGYFISVVPGPRHLFELKQVIYDTPRLHEPEKCPSDMVLKRSEQLTNQVILQDQEILAALLTMTPFAWKLTADKKRQIIEGGRFDVTFDFVLNLYRAI